MSSSDTVVVGIEHFVSLTHCCVYTGLMWIYSFAVAANSHGRESQPAGSLWEHYDCHAGEQGNEEGGLIPCFSSV